MDVIFNAQELVQKFDEFLTERSITFSAVIIGGGALSVMKIITRETKDIDVLDDEIPEEVVRAAEDFAKINGLPDHWLNCGPSDLKRNLDSGWESKLQKIFSGNSIEFWTLSRLDLLKSKVWALCDRQKDLDDVLALKPTVQELEKIRKWLHPLDGNPDWPEYIDSVVASLARQLNYKV